MSSSPRVTSIGHVVPSLEVSFLSEEQLKLYVSFLRAPESYEIVCAWGAIGPNARELLRDLAKRLELGVTYGDFDDDRNLKAETLPELLDSLVYLTGELKKQLKKGG